MKTVINYRNISFFHRSAVRVRYKPVLPLGVCREGSGLRHKGHVEDTNWSDTRVGMRGRDSEGLDKRLAAGLAGVVGAFSG